MRDIAFEDRPNPGLRAWCAYTDALSKDEYRQCVNRAFARSLAEEAGRDFDGEQREATGPETAADFRRWYQCWQASLS